MWPQATPPIGAIRFILCRQAKSGAAKKENVSHFAAKAPPRPPALRKRPPAGAFSRAETRRGPCAGCVFFLQYARLGIIMFFENQFSKNFQKEALFMDNFTVSPVVEQTLAQLKALPCVKTSLDFLKTDSN